MLDEKRIERVELVAKAFEIAYDSSMKRGVERELIYTITKSKHIYLIKYQIIFMRTAVWIVSIEVLKKMAPNELKEFENSEEV